METAVTYHYPDWYYPSWYINGSVPDKHEQAFKIARILIENKLVETKKVKDFIALVEMIFGQL